MQNVTSHHSSAAAVMGSINSPIAVIVSAVTKLRGVRILDIGCGDGGLARQLAAEGASVTGVDPNEQAIAKARTVVPEARFEVATAEALPFVDRRFDLVVMLNALHHVPVALMDTALAEACRVLRDEGNLIILEPLASGNFFEALRRVEDETEVRHAAQLALLRAVPRFASHLTHTYVRREAYDTPEQFLARIIAVDPARQPAVDADRAEIIAAIAAAAIDTGDGKLAFDQPIKADILSILAQPIGN